MLRLEILVEDAGNQEKNSRKKKKHVPERECGCVSLISPPWPDSSALVCLVGVRPGKGAKLACKDPTGAHADQKQRVSYEWRREAPSMLFFSVDHPRHPKPGGSADAGRSEAEVAAGY